MKKWLSIILTLAMILSLMSVASITVSAETTTIYKFTFENGGDTILKKATWQNGGFTPYYSVGEIVEWPAGSGNHCLKYELNSDTHTGAGIHPFIWPEGIADVLRSQGVLGTGENYQLTLDFACTGNTSGSYIYPFLLCNGDLDDENYFDKSTFAPSGSFQTHTWTLSKFEAAYPMAGEDGDASGGIAFVDELTLDDGAYVYIDNVTFVKNGTWKAIPDGTAITYLDGTPAEGGITVDPNAGKGDVDEDGDVTMKDVLLIRKYVAHLLATFNKSAADVNRDNKVTMLDVLLMRKFIATIYYQLPVAVYSGDSTGQLVLSVDQDVEAVAGEEVEVNFTVDANSGVWGMALDVAYDTSILTLKSVTYGSDLRNLGFLGVEEGAETFQLNATPAGFDNVTGTGVMATAIFTVADTAKIGDTADITVTYDKNNVIDKDGNRVKTTVYNGSVTVVKEASEQPSSLIVSIDNVTGKPGEDVAVNFVLDQNPGFWGLAFNAYYNDSVLTLKSITFGSAFRSNGIGFKEVYPGDNPIEIDCTNGSLDYNCYATGVLATAIFTISPDARPGTVTAISTSFKANNQIDVDMNDVPLAIYNGSVTVAGEGAEDPNAGKGDVDEDGIVTMKDVLLIRKYVAHLLATFNKSAADVNRDNKVTMLDVLLMRKFIATIYYQLPVAVYSGDSTGQLVLSVDQDVEAVAGEEVEVNFTVDANSGVWGMALDVAYDTSILTLKSVIYGPDLSELGFLGVEEGAETFQLNATPVGFDNVTGTGVMATAIFTVADTAKAGDTADITVTYDKNNVIDKDGNRVKTTVYDGSVTVVGNGEEPVVDPSADFEYTFINDGRTVQITGYTGDGGDVVIPAMIEGKPVSEIADYAFYGCDSVTSITIPVGVSHIGSFAFGYCNQLENVYYEGSEADREAMTIENGNDVLVDATWTNPTSDEPSEPADVVAGDADGDGNVTMKDVLKLRKAIAGVGDDVDKDAADVDGDGQLTMKDVLKIRKFIAGLIDKLGR